MIQITDDVMTEVWYELEYSYKDANDWYKDGFGYDSIETAQEKLDERRGLPGFDYRIVRVTKTTEPLR